MSKDKKPPSISEATDAVFRGEAMAGPPAAGSAGAEWGGVDADEKWTLSDDERTPEEKFWRDQLSHITDTSKPNP